MTEDYKKTLLDYTTGSVQENLPTVDEIIKEIIELDKDDWQNGTILPSQWKNLHFEEIIQDKLTGNFILYGGYRDNTSTEINVGVYGIITLLNSSFKPIKSFFEYNNGTKLRYIQRLKQAEDNTFYLIDDTNYAFTYNDTILNSQKRFVMVNNFASKFNDSYTLLIRKTYIFPSQYNIFKCENIEKNPNDSQYIMVGRKYTDSFNNYTGVWCIELNIPYGESPTWNKTNIVAGDSGFPFNTSFFITSLITFNENKFAIKVIGLHNYRESSASTLYHYIRYYYKDYNSTTYSTRNILDISNTVGQSTQYSYLENQGIFLNENNVYFVVSNLESPQYGTTNLQIALYNYNINENNINQIYYKSYGTNVASHNEQIYLAKNQGKLYIENIINKGNHNADYYIQRYEGEWEPILIGENKPYYWSVRNLYVNNEYNLLKIFLYSSSPTKSYWYYPIVKEIYNPTQYNGESYINENSLCPLYVNLYSNGSLVFSRDLYNISKQNNMTMSSVEIPNTYLNDTTITQNDLISETNLPMNSDSTSWNKNIYEVVDLNFINTISIIDEDTNISYLDSAIKLNNATTDGGDTNYQNTPCTKYRINYNDNTLLINELKWNTIDDTHKETIITFYVDKQIESIDLISYDETTIYLHIPVEVEIGKYYSINQKLRIGE